MKTTTTLLALTLTLSIPAPSSFAHYEVKKYPHWGDIYYDGGYYADSMMEWHVRPGGWQTNNPGLEIDITVDKGFFESCTSWTNLPSPYDDCDTAGYSEPDPNRITFGVGSYDPQYILAATPYKAQWYFSGGTLPATFFDVSWQEVFHYFCGYDGIWCMLSNDGSRLLTGAWSFGQQRYNSWYF